MAEAIVLEMGFVWNPIHIESGIDAIIELRDPLTGETKNKILQVQVKAVSNFAAEQGDAFSFSCERAHIAYWLGGTARVILIVCRPDTDEIYWKDLQSYFSIPQNRERCTVRFSKQQDKFTVSCRSALTTVAKPEGGIALGPLPKREILGINLLPVSGYPSQICKTETKATAWDDFFSGLKELKLPWVREFIWRAGVLYSFFDPAQEGIGALCKGKSQFFLTFDWANSDDSLIQRFFAELLGKAFENFCYHKGVLVDRETGIFYFAAPEKGEERTLTTKSRINTTTKTVVSKHSSTRTDGSEGCYYRHHAFKGRMRRFSTTWYFELTPTYYFTEDGQKPLENAEALLKGIKRLERQPAVLSTFLTWKEYLTEDNLFSRVQRGLKLLSPAALSIDRGIDDKAWRQVGSLEEISQSTEEEDVEVSFEDEISLFSWRPNY